MIGDFLVFIDKVFWHEANGNQFDLQENCLVIINIYDAKYLN